MLLHETVSRTAERRPEAPAVAFCGECVTYGQLDETSSRLARMLLDAGCRKGDRVGILAPKSIPAITAFLGALKAGCIYVPMDTAGPAARLAKVLNVAEPRCVLAAEPAGAILAATLSEEGVPKNMALGWLSESEPQQWGIRAGFRWSDLASLPAQAPACRTTSGDPAHILFTSGSTGVPKGVVITHANVLHFIEWAVGYFRIDSSDRISGHPPLQFDLSTFDIYGTFLAGAQLHLVPSRINLQPHKLAEFIRANALTQWFSVPAVLKYMAQFEAIRPGDFPALKRLLWCGEALPAPTLMYFMERLPHVRFTNLYGPTETTIASSYYTVPCRPEDPNAAIPIGRACAGETLVILDECSKPVAAGETGELFIGGVGLSPGYWKDPRKTEAAFQNHAEFGRIYKTGDLAKAGGDGLIYLLGRVDSQIKSRGYRIELGEIEAALHALGIVRECAVVAVDTLGFEGKAICCAYVPQPGVETAPADLRDRLGTALPPYMMPSQWLRFESLPLNGNGKVDRPLLRRRFLGETTVAQGTAGAGRR